MIIYNVDKKAKEKEKIEEKDYETTLATWDAQLQTEFNTMINSVGINGGFYISRYEMSLRTLNSVKIAQSKKGQPSATSSTDSANSWYGLYQRSREYSEKNSLTDVVGSSMVWGSQYDQMMIWMKNNQIDVSKEIPIKGAVLNTTRVTGDVETDKLNNVYDILGNSYEWTQEALLTYRRVVRSGGYDGSWPPSSRYFNIASVINGLNSTRITLYVK